MWVRLHCLQPSKKKSMRQHTLPPQAQRDRRKNQPDRECKAAPVLLALDILRATKDQGMGSLCSQRGLLIFGTAGKSQMKEGASEELRKGKGMKDRLLYPVRDHASRQSPLQTRGCLGHHKTALQFHSDQQNQVVYPAECHILLPHIQQTNPASLLWLWHVCVLTYWIFRSYEFDPFHTGISMVKMWTYTCHSTGWWNRICFCKKYQGHLRNTIELW